MKNVTEIADKLARKHKELKKEYGIKGSLLSGVSAYYGFGEFAELKKQLDDLTGGPHSGYYGFG